MPYIKQEKRKVFDEVLKELVRLLKEDEGSKHGNLNYCLTKLMLECLPEDYRYKDLQDMIGMITSCSNEFYRRLVSKYENEKIRTNGDVY